MPVRGLVLRDQSIGFLLDVGGAAGELVDQLLGDGRKLPSEVVVLAPVPLLPLNPEQSGHAVGQHRVVVLGDRDIRLEHRSPVQAAPSPVLRRLDLAGDDDVGVKLRIAQPGVPVVVRRGGNSDDVRLHHGTVAGGYAPPRGDHFPFHEVEHLGDGLVVGLDDERLGASVGHTPQCGD